MNYFMTIPFLYKLKEWIKQNQMNYIPAPVETSLRIFRQHPEDSGLKRFSPMLGKTTTTNTETQNKDITVTRVVVDKVNPKPFLNFKFSSDKILQCLSQV